MILADAPDARLPGVTDHIDLLRSRLREAGASTADLETTTTLDEVYLLAGDIGNRPAGEQVNLREIAARAEVDLDVVQGFLRSSGLVADDVDARVWYSSDIEWVRAANAACSVFGDEAISVILRRAGAAMSQLSNAASSVFRVNLVDVEIVDPMVIIERNLATQPLIDTLLAVVSQLYRYHSRLSFREETVAAGTFGELRAMTVGFVDLASSTELGARLSATDLARSMNDFNREAFTAATRNGARLVKTIGDEVMLCALDPNAVCRTALALVEFSQEHATFASARAGISHGDVLEQDGDCYGPIVNRAARFVESAPDGRVMVDAAVASALGAEFTTTPEPTMEHRGLGAVEWLAVTRADG